jgi:hypothetical protein
MDIVDDSGVRAAWEERIRVRGRESS